MHDSVALNKTAFHEKAIEILNVFWPQKIQFKQFGVLL